MTISLADHGGNVFFASPDAVGGLAGFINTFSYGAVAVETTIGRYTKDDGTVEIVPQAGNSLGAENVGPLVGPVVINEIRYRPLGDALEFIELHNTSGFAVPLFDPANPANTYRLAGDVQLAAGVGHTVHCDLPLTHAL